MTFGEWLRAILGTYKWLHPRLIKREVGYQFVARLHDDQIVQCQVVKHVGLVFDSWQVWSPEIGTISFKDILAWREL